MELSQWQSFLRHDMWGNRRSEPYGSDWLRCPRKVVRFRGGNAVHHVA